MTTSGLATPPRAARPRVPPPDSRPPPPPRYPTRRRRSFERILGWSIGVSVVIHLLLLLLSPLFIRIDIPPGAVDSANSEAPNAFGLEMIVAIPSATAPEFPVQEAERQPPVQRRAQPDQPTRAIPGRVPVPSAAPGDQQQPSARDALRPGYRDPRLYVAPRDFPELEKTEHERYMEHLQARIDALNDSMRVAANRERTTSDWTVTDGAGRKWGLDGDGLHVGGVTIPRELIPSPRPTGDNATREAGAEVQRQRDEIRRQEEDRERRETQDERIDATRQSQDERRNSGSGN